MDFIDLDSPSDTLLPWLCDSSLKMLQARISEISRPDINRIAQDEYNCQGRDLQHMSSKAGGGIVLTV
ncbi:hypothetical protein F5H01DRAFT_366375 [Linnemannia elongata]|nr:hypothetical protein F5H01DRAFT_366375 [Linnemannia elongata]